MFPECWLFDGEPYTHGSSVPKRFARWASKKTKAVERWIERRILGASDTGLRKTNQSYAFLGKLFIFRVEVEFRIDLGSSRKTNPGIASPRRVSHQKRKQHARTRWLWKSGSTESKSSEELMPSLDRDSNLAAAGLASIGTDEKNARGKVTGIYGTLEKCSIASPSKQLRYDAFPRKSYAQTPALISHAPFTKKKKHYKATSSTFRTFFSLFANRNRWRTEETVKRRSLTGHGKLAIFIRVNKICACSR